MAYATRQDIIDRYGEDQYQILATPAAGGTVDVDAALQDASDELDTYLAARYELPLSETPSVLVRACVDIAVYLLAQQDATRMTESMRQRYEDVVRMMRDIGSGKASLGIEKPAPSTGGKVHVATGPERIFSRDSLKDF